ncbi:PREDICTED: exopolygalacturonase-like [Nicotiana attenuata]|uniref:Exopolygalacturonase n=1 Tax=Nicotiana attenuata TaxID=49451 RepID=A0A1J6INN6_NICAT|nr:PREDICTED: exopolygalacturonase-like [Nicotiana attenuata]OIS99334.1 exopolygalacturonase [Nicotiana attenuata]
MVSLASASFSVCLFVFLCIANAQYYNSPLKFFNVLDYGAVADEKRDNGQAFLKAWEDACQWRGRSMVLIPYGTYMLRSVSFEGPCRSLMRFVIKGVLKAPTSPSLFNTNTWIGFRYINGLVVKGGGYLDGQGASAWPYNDCSKNPHCMPLPVTLRFDFVTNSRIHHLRSINSKNSHINLFACNNINISFVRMTAPGDSPNTDGIHIGASTNIRISRTVIQTGDDCISMVTGSRNIDISDVTCGPGHGISIGSLGKSPGEFVTGINVRNCTFIGTQNGARIKTWAPSLSSEASDIFFGDIYMQNVNNPILIDQQYCPYPSCSNLGHDNSKVQISNVTFSNIWGTSSSKVAVTLKCSKLVPCKNVQLNNINLAYHGRGGPATSSCLNVIGASYGKQSPPSCL